MRRSGVRSGLAAMAAILPPVPVAAQPVPEVPAHEPRAIWVNPSGSVKVEIGDCADKLCGWVTWASAEAEQDARDGGTPKLVGTELLQDYHQTSPDNWTGRVFVPDWGRSFYSTIHRLNPGALKIRGCILGGWVCRSQIWHRLSAP